jgi:trigger factor
LKSTIKLSDGLIREIEVEIPAEQVDSAFAETYHKYRTEGKIKGFRPGKAPLTVIKSKFGDAIRDDVLQELIEKSYPEAIREHKLDVASHPSFPTLDLKEGSPLVYVAKVEVMPEIEKIDFDGLKLPLVEFEVKDDEVDMVVEYLRKKHADTRPVERASEKDDSVVVDLEKLEDPGNVLDRDKFEDFEVDLGSKYTVAEFRDALLGANKGDDKEIQVSYADDYADEKFAGKSIKYKCHVKEIKEHILPETNDAFAKQLGETETFLELRLKIRDDLRKQKELDQRKHNQDEIRRQLLEKNKIDIPNAMVKNYLESLAEDFKKNSQPFEEDKLEEQYRPMAETSLGWSILMNRLAEDEKIEVLPSDTENWIKRFAESYKMEPDKAREMLAQTGRIQEIREKILEDKLFDFLTSKATFEPVEGADSVEMNKDITEEL